MSASTWPTGFPAPERTGYRWSQPELNQRTDFALGGRVRPMFADGADQLSAAVVLTHEQWAYLQGWHRYALANGANWFDVPLLAAGLQQTVEARFTGPMSFDLYAIGYVRVTLPLETRAGTTMSPTDWAAL